MKRTKCDLSGSVVTLDYDALQRVAYIAFANAKNLLAREVNALSEIGLSSQPDNAFVQHAQEAARYAEQVAVVSEVLHTLTAGLERGKVIIANKPEVSDD